MGLDFYITTDKTCEDENKTIFYGRKCWDIAEYLIPGKGDLNEVYELDIKAYDDLLSKIRRIIGIAYQLTSLEDFYDEDIRKKIDTLLEVYMKWHDDTFDTEPPFGYMSSAHTIVSLWESASLIHYLLKKNEPVWVYASYQKKET